MPERPPIRSIPPLTLNAWLRWDLVRRILADVPARSVLEVGCGQGAVGARLAECYDYVGYEPDRDSFERARARIGAFGTVVNDVLPGEPTRTFDVVCAFEVLEHIEDDAAALADWSAWLRPAGTLLLSVPARPERFGPADEAVGHYRRYDPPTLAARLAAAGFTEPELRMYGFPLGYVLELARDRRARSTGTALSVRRRSERSERTAASGRWGQPSDSLGWATRLATLPFRLIQRPFARSGPGTGIVAMARRPA